MDPASHRVESECCLPSHLRRICCEFRGEPPQEKWRATGHHHQAEVRTVPAGLSDSRVGQQTDGRYYSERHSAWADTMPLGAAGEGGAIKRKVWELLRAIFNHAVETPLDMDGTTLLTKSPVLIEVSKPCSDVAYGNVSAEELETLYQAMTPRFAPVIYLIGIMGMRPGEVTALQRQDIVLADDLSGGIIHITKTAKPIRVPDSETGGGHRDILIGRPKTRGSVRDLEIPASLAGILDKHIRTYVLDAPDSFLFTGERTHTVVDDQRLRNAWYNARRSVPRLEQRGLRLYDLRHRAARRNEDLHQLRQDNHEGYGPHAAQYGSALSACNR